MKTWRKIPWLSLVEAKTEIALLNETVPRENDPRTRIKLARRLGFAGMSMAFCQTTLSLPELDQGIAALTLARKAGAVLDDLNRSQAWLTKLRLEAMGCADAAILGEKSMTVSVDSACLAAAPKSDSVGTLLSASNDEILAAMNQGRFFLVSVPADGRYRVTLRLIDAIEPVLKPQEYNNLEASTEVGFLWTDGGELRFGAAENLEAAATLDAPNGMAKVQVFSLLNRNTEKIILVACQTAVAPPPLDHVPEIAI